MFATLCNVISDRRGATAIEYTMVAFFISIMIVAAVETIGTSVSSSFATIASSF